MRELHAEGVAREQERLRLAKAEADARTSEEKARKKREKKLEWLQQSEHKS